MRRQSIDRWSLRGPVVPMRRRSIDRWPLRGPPYKLLVGAEHFRVELPRHLLQAIDDSRPRPQQ